MNQAPSEIMRQWIERAQHIIQTTWRDPQRRNLLLGALGALILLLFVYRFGIWRGRQLAQRELLPGLAQLATPQPTGELLAVVVPSPTRPPTITPTPLPTLTPTPTATAASDAEWAERFRSQAQDGLNALVAADFSPERADTLLRNLAQEHGLVFVPLSYTLIEADAWVALITPRTPAGQALPMLFWQDPHNRNQIRGQLLSAALVESAQGASNDVAAQANQLLQTGLRHGLLRVDAQGRFHLLLIEASLESRAQRDLNQPLSVLALTQPQAGGDFEAAWWSVADPFWSVAQNGGHYELIESEGQLLPDILVTAPLLMSGQLRQELGAPALFQEQAPFARQRARTLWKPQFDFVTGQLTGYKLESGELFSSPLATLQRLLLLLQTSNVSEAGALVTRLDLLQQAVDLELTKPATWMAFYVDSEGRPLLDEGNSGEQAQDDQARAESSANQVRFFDNANRNRTFDAFFEQDDNGYKVAAFQPVSDIYSDSRLVTPASATVAPDLPTATNVPPSDTPAPTPTFDASLTTDLAGTLNLTETTEFTGFQTITEAVVAEIRSISQTATALSQTAHESPDSAATLIASTNSTPTPTATPTETATPSPTDMPTATETSTPLPTDTPTPPGLSAVTPNIPPEQPGFVTGSVAASNTNLRGGPGVDYVVVGQPELNDPVEYFGITEAGDWLLLRINKPDSPYHGVIGWMAMTLLRWDTDLSGLPRYRADGSSVDAAPNSSTETNAAANAAANAGTEGVVAAAALVAPALASIPGTPAPPPPDITELLVTLGGDQIPADPLALIEATASDGRALRLRLDAATVEIWSGLFGEAPGAWRAAAGALLWPGTRAYVAVASAGGAEGELIVERIRIVVPPPQERSQLISLPILAASVQSETIMGLLGSREQPGVYVLESAGTLQQLLVAEQDATWIGQGENASLLLRTPDQTTGLNSFSWVRSDGSGLLIYARPFYAIHGVVGDAQGDLWWIEAPQVDVHQWLLWRYDSQGARIALYMQSDGALFVRRGASQAPLIPVLLATLADQTSAESATFLVDTIEPTRQQLNSGLYRLVLRRNAGEDAKSADDLLTSLAPLLPVGAYRGPLQVSPDGAKLAYFDYDPSHPSLTAGFITPANQLKVLALSGAETGNHQVVYETETRFEFLAPNLAWRGNLRLLLARSRFAATESFDLDRFGAVEVRLPGAIEGVETLDASSYLLPNREEIRDFVPCRDGEFTLLITQEEEGLLKLARWRGEGQPRPLFGLPIELNRTFVCWRAPAPAP